MQAALGLEALKYLDRWTADTQAHAAQVTARLADIPGVRLPTVPSDRTHVFYQYCAYVADRDATVLRCLKRGVDLETLHVDVCTELPLFESFASPAPGAEATEQAVQIPVYESLSAAEVDRVADVVHAAASPRGATASAPAAHQGNAAH